MNTIRRHCRCCDFLLFWCRDTKHLPSTPRHRRWVPQRNTDGFRRQRASRRPTAPYCSRTHQNWRKRRLCTVACGVRDWLSVRELVASRTHGQTNLGEQNRDRIECASCHAEYGRYRSVEFRPKAKSGRVSPNTVASDVVVVGCSSAVANWRRWSSTADQRGRQQVVTEIFVINRRPVSLLGLYRRSLSISQTINIT